MATEWSPEQRAQQAALRRELAAIRQMLASWHIAEDLDEPPQVCARLVRRMWQRLDGLSDDDARLAVLMLLTPAAVEDAHRVLTVPDDASMVTAGWWQ